MTLCYSNATTTKSSTAKDCNCFSFTLWCSISGLDLECNWYPRAGEFVSAVFRRSFKTAISFEESIFRPFLNCFDVIRECHSIAKVHDLDAQGALLAEVLLSKYKANVASARAESLKITIFNSDKLSG